MGIAVGTCVQCGGPVARYGRQHCWFCLRRIRQAAARSRCSGCGKDRVLRIDTGWCVLCSRRCEVCTGPVRARDQSVCRPCQRRAAREAAKALCPRCGKPGFLCQNTGWCGSCSRPAGRASRHEPVSHVDSCDATPRPGCVHAAGNATPTGRSPGWPTSSPHCRTRHSGWAISGAPGMDVGGFGRCVGSRVRVRGVAGG
jgi:hypothetical protein